MQAGSYTNFRSGLKDQVLSRDGYRLIISKIEKHKGIDHGVSIHLPSSEKFIGIGGLAYTRRISISRAKLK
jgi:hypothetical protein